MKVSAVSGVINTPTLIFQDEAAVTTMAVAQGPRAPMFAGCQRDLPILVTEAFPTIQFDDSLESEVQRKISDSPWHHSNFRSGQPPKSWFVKMIEVSMRQQDEVDRRKILDFQAGTFQSFQQEEPVSKIRIDQDIKVGELNQKGCMADPGHGDLTLGQFRKSGALMLTGSASEQC